MVEGLVLAGAHVFGDRLPPFLGVVEHRVDVEHDAAERIKPVPDDLAIYGFARPGERSLPLPIATYRSRPVESFQGNDRNIAVLARYFTGRPLDAVESGATRPDLRGR